MHSNARHDNPVPVSAQTPASAIPALAAAIAPTVGHVPYSSGAHTPTHAQVPRLPTTPSGTLTALNASRQNQSREAADGKHMGVENRFMQGMLPR